MLYLSLIFTFNFENIKIDKIYTFFMTTVSLRKSDVYRSPAIVNIELKAKA